MRAVYFRCGKCGDMGTPMPEWWSDERAGAWKPCPWCGAVMFGYRFEGWADGCVVVEDLVLEDLVLEQ